MTRAGALATVAASCMRDGVLLQYEPGETLVVDHLLGGAERIVVLDAEGAWIRKHVFDAAPFKPEHGAGRAFGYSVDERA